MNSYALQAYKNVKVSTASEGDLILMLFDGAIRFANQAINVLTILILLGHMTNWCGLKILCWS